MAVPLPTLFPTMVTKIYCYKLDSCLSVLVHVERQFNTYVCLIKRQDYS